MVIATSAGRVPSNTSFDVNMRLNEKFHRSIAYYADHPRDIPDRLAELDREWDVERALATLSSSLSLAGLALGFRVARRWFVLPALVQSMYLQHTIQGWCPPLPVLRRMGFRTPSEIDREKGALKELLRTDNAQQTGGSRSTGVAQQRQNDLASSQPGENDDEDALGFSVIYEEFSTR